MADIRGPVVDNKYRQVQVLPEGEAIQADGSWEEVVHDCALPGIDEIIRRSAAVGSIWKCAGCSAAWVLRRPKPPQPIHDLHTNRPMSSTRGNTLNHSIAEALQWVRKRDIKDQEH